ncbi:hypothetical protein HDU96_007570 [Phlyctochytrium bullatum]|nr:hypothetical protein HDU96_007570 [Phlyctochytrium bullatum]
MWTNTSPPRAVKTLSHADLQTASGGITPANVPVIVGATRSDVAVTAAVGAFLMIIMIKPKPPTPGGSEAGVSCNGNAPLIAMDESPVDASTSAGDVGPAAERSEHPTDFRFVQVLPVSTGQKVIVRSRHSLACTRCRAKKRKCDGVRPICAACIKDHKADPSVSTAEMCFFEESVVRRCKLQKGDEDKVSTGHDIVARSRLNIACIRCRAKKRKCDRVRPACGECVRRHRADPSVPPAKLCVYQESTTKQRKPKKPDGDVDGAAVQSRIEPTATQRYETLENLLTEASPSPRTVSSPSSTRKDSTPSASISAATALELCRATLLGPSGPSLLDLFAAAPSTGLLDFSSPRLRHSIFAPPSVPGPFSAPHAPSHIRLDESFLGMLQAALDGNTAGDTLQVPGHRPVAVSVVPPPPPVVSMQHYSDLDDHLVAVYFAAVNTALPIINEAEFMKAFVPKDRQPVALVSAMRGAAALFSNHPKLLERFRTRTAALQHYFATAKEHAAKIEDDALKFIQTSILLAMWDYGAFLGAESYKWNGRACQELFRLDVPSSEVFANHNKYSIWFVPREATERESEARFRAMAGLFFLDTMVLMVSALDPTMYEDERQCHLIAWEARLRAKREAVRAARGVIAKDGWEPGEWVERFWGFPADTVFDDGFGRAHPFLTQCKTSTWWLPGHVTVPDVPPFMATTEFDLYLQISFIIRKVCRYAFLTSVATGDEVTTVPVVKLLTKPIDPDQMHEALMEFYASIPPSERPFPTLDDIPLPGKPLPAFPTTASWMRSATSLNVLLSFFSALILLHDCTISLGRGMERRFVLREGPPSRIPDPSRLRPVDIVGAAAQAQVYILRGVYHAHGCVFPTRTHRWRDWAKTADPASMMTDPGSPLGPSPEECVRLDTVLRNTLPREITEMLGWEGDRLLPKLLTAHEGAAGTRDPFLGPLSPPPPMPLAINPVTPFFVFSAAVAVLRLVVCDDLIGSNRTFREEMNAGSIVAECLPGITSVMVPTLMELARVWKTADISRPAFATPSPASTMSSTVISSWFQDDKKSSHQQQPAMQQLSTHIPPPYTASREESQPLLIQISAPSSDVNPSNGTFASNARPSAEPQTILFVSSARGSPGKAPVLMTFEDFERMEKRRKRRTALAVVAILVLLFIWRPIRFRIDNTHLQYNYPDSPDLIPSKEFEEPIKCNPDEAQYPVYPANGEFDLPLDFNTLNFTVQGIARGSVLFVAEGHEDDGKPSPTPSPEDPEAPTPEEPENPTDDTDLSVPRRRSRHNKRSLSAPARASIHFHLSNATLIPNVTLTVGEDAPGVFGIHVQSPNRYRVPEDGERMPCILAIARIVVPKEAFAKLARLNVGMDIGALEVRMAGDAIGEAVTVDTKIGSVLVTDAVVGGKGVTVRSNVGSVTLDKVVTSSVANVSSDVGSVKLTDVDAHAIILNSDGTGSLSVKSSLAATNITLSADVGSVKVEDTIAGGDIDIEADGTGSINVKNTKASSLTTASDIGSIHLETIELTGPVLTATVSGTGSIQISHVVAPALDIFTATTDLGSVRIKDVRMPTGRATAVKVSTDMGESNVQLNDFEGRFEVKGSNARVKGTGLEFEVNTKRKVEGVRGEGKQTLEVKSGWGTAQVLLE